MYGKWCSGRPNGWIEDVQRSGSPFVSGISSIQAAIDICGDVTATSASFEVMGTNHWRATGQMSGPNKELVLVIISLKISFFSYRWLRI